MVLHELRNVTEAVLPGIREHLEARVARWRASNDLPAGRGQAITRGMCRGASHGLRMILEREIPGARWTVAGGWGVETTTDTVAPGRTVDDAVRTLLASERPDVAAHVDLDLWPGGMVDDAGTWHGHFWVEGEAECGGRIIADLTADQFGHGDTVVADGNDVRYRGNIRPGCHDKEFTLAEAQWGSALFFSYEPRIPAGDVPAPRGM